MYELTLKRRISIFFGVLFLLIPLGCGGLYIALDSVAIYFSFPPSFVFSSFTVYGFTIFLMVIPLTFLSFFPVFLGRLASLPIQKNISLFIFVCFFFFIALQIGFKLYFDVRRPARFGFHTLRQYQKTPVAVFPVRHAPHLRVQFFQHRVLLRYLFQVRRNLPAQQLQHAPARPGQQQRGFLP